MCGICGFYGKLNITREQLAAMNDTLYHRGPDDSGVIYPLPSLITIFYTVQNGLPTGFVWKITDFFCAVPTTLNILCVIAMSGVYFKLVKDYKARYMGIGTVDPNFKVFYEKDPNEKK